MFRSWHKHVLVALTVACCLAAMSCRSRKKSQKIGSAALKLVLTFKNIEEVVKAKLTNLAFEARCNGGDWIPGVLTDEPKLEAEFFIKGIKIGDTCAAQIRDPAPPAEYEFTQDEGVLYGTSDNIEISTRSVGQLWAEALLSRYYTLKSNTNRLKVPVVFKGAFPSDAGSLVAELKCSPEFEGLALGLQEGDANRKVGTFVFASGLQTGVEYTCTRIKIRRQKLILYFGDLGQQKFKAQATGDTVSNSVELEAVEVLTTQGVVIVTTPGKACNSGEIFDIDTRSCRMP